MALRDVGDYIREQRHAAQVSLRQLAKAAGVSNPYLSQIERGLRKPSAEILQQIAKALRISAEQLYVRAGILDERVGDDTVTAAVLAWRSAKPIASPSASAISTSAIGLGPKRCRPSVTMSAFTSWRSLS